MRRIQALLIALGIIILLFPGEADAADPPNGWSIQAFSGLPLNLRSTLVVTQQGYSDIEHLASWRTRPFEQPFYWALRLRRQRSETAWELQLLHHKLYLHNNPPEIEHLEVTHGFNIATINWVRRRAGWDLRMGAGLVLPRAESTIHGNQHSSTGYEFAGPALLVAAGRQHGISRRFYGVGEIQLIAAWAEIEVADGNAEVRSIAFHVLLGVGCAL